MTLCDQRLKPTDEIRGACKAQFLQGRRRQAGAVTLIAYNDHALVTVHVQEPRLTGRRQPPLKDVPVDYQSTEQRAVPLTLFQWSDINDNGPGRDFVAQFANVNSLEGNSSVRKKLVDREMRRINNEPMVSGDRMLRVRYGLDMDELKISRAVNPVTLVLKDSVEIACSLENVELGERIDDWNSLLAQAVDRTTLLDGLRVTFSRNVNVGALSELAASEQTCCRFFTFAIGITNDAVSLDITGSEDAQPVIASLFGA